ncbi:hypothetical protein HK102_002318 [Quaeritorhiza haematococci]|nr:hypothetical protein HK102_002318 [Quaeritorhiza haematococci]
MKTSLISTLAALSLGLLSTSVTVNAQGLPPPFPVTCAPQCAAIQNNCEATLSAATPRLIGVTDPAALAAIFVPSAECLCGAATGDCATCIAASADVTILSSCAQGAPAVADVLARAFLGSTTGGAPPPPPPPSGTAPASAATGTAVASAPARTGAAATSTSATRATGTASPTPTSGAVNLNTNVVGGSLFAAVAGFVAYLL